MTSAKVIVFVMLFVVAVCTSTISAARTYNDIAKVINPNLYSKVGPNALPFWTFAGR